MEPILYIGITQSVFAGLMIATKKPQQLSDRVLATWLFMIGVKMLISLLEINFPEYFINKLGFLVIPLTYGPLLYMYILFLTTEKPVFRIRYWFHFIPFAVLGIMTLFLIDSPISDHHFFTIDSYFVFRILYGFSSFISVIFYSILALVLITRHQRNIRNHFSYSSEKLTLNWLKIVSISFSIAYLFMFISGAFNVFSNTQTFQPQLFSNLGLTFFAFAFSFYGFKQPAIFKWSNGEKKFTVEASKIIVPEISKEIKYEKSGLKVNTAKQHLENLLKYMDKEKPYLNGELTIQDISKELGIPRHHITQVLSKHLNKNFYTFVNEYRIEEVKRRLVAKEYENYTLVAIAYDSGFSSKSTFNMIFKNYTGLTPSEYKNNQKLCQ